MANQIKMAMSVSIIELHGRGWSQRRIARVLGLNRETVSRHIRLHEAAEASKPANLPAGIDGAPVVDVEGPVEDTPSAQEEIDQPGN